MMSDLRSRNSRYEETQITGSDAKNQLDDQVDIAEEVVVKAAYLGRGHDGRISMSIGSDSETVISRGDERPPVERRTKKKPPRSPPRGLERSGSNFSDNTSKYLGSVYTEYVREMDEPVAVGRGGEASDLALEMQHEFNMKLAETIEKEHERKTPVYAEVRGEKKKGRSYNGSYKSELFVSEDIDATIDAAFKETFEEEDRHMNPVMGTEAILEKKKKREEKEKTKGGRRMERKGTKREDPNEARSDE